MWKETRRSVSNFLWKILTFWYYKNDTSDSQAKSSRTKKPSKGQAEVEKNESPCESKGHARSQETQMKVKTKPSLHESILVSRKNRVSREILRQPLWKSNMKYNEYKNSQ